MATEIRNTEGPALASTLLQGSEVYTPHPTLEGLAQTTALLDACLFYDDGEATWREADLVKVTMFAMYVLVGNN